MHVSNVLTDNGHQTTPEKPPCTTQIPISYIGLDGSTIVRYAIQLPTALWTLSHVQNDFSFYHQSFATCLKGEHTQYQIQRVMGELCNTHDLLIYSIHIIGMGVKFIVKKCRPNPVRANYV